MTDICCDTPAPEQNDFVRYWFEDDSILNVHSEIIFSLLGRYSCFAGCKVCYTEGHFKRSLHKFKDFIPQTIPAELEKQWNVVFDHFSRISSIDDIFWMKHEQPHLYKWYLDNQHRFAWGNMTDNNFIRTQPLFMQDFDPTEIYEITFSDEFLEKVDVQDIILKLNELISKHSLSKIKLILNSEDSLEQPGTKAVYDWCKTNNIYNPAHHNFHEEHQVFENISQMQHVVNFESEIFPVCRESDYLQYNGFFLTLIDSIDHETKPYHQFETFDNEKHLALMLQGKVDLYKRWNDLYASGKVQANTTGKKYFEYYNWVTRHIKVNNDYNFIPIDMLNAKHKYYHKLTEGDWTITEFGLLKNNTTKVIPLMEILNGN
jgi:hypothetical protein